jgi:DNA-binding MarR family transcriptional regulator
LLGGARVLPARKRTPWVVAELPGVLPDCCCRVDGLAAARPPPFPAFAPRRGPTQESLAITMVALYNHCVIKLSAPPNKATTAAFRRHLRVLEREVVRQLEADTGCCGVTLAQCHALLELAASELSLSGLAAALDLDTSTLSRTVEGLVRAGTVVRAEDASDRRSVRLTLTDAGRAKVAFIDDICNRYYDDLLGGMSEQERRCVMRAVGLLAERMRSLRTARCCSKTEGCDGKK